MKKSVNLSEIKGRIKAPASKSALQRLLALSFLCGGKTIIEEAVYSGDVKSAISLITALGADVEINERDITVKKGNREPEKNLNAGESGLGIRMFSSVASLDGVAHEIRAEGSLKKRPALIIKDALCPLGVDVRLNGGFPPVQIKGPLKGGVISIDGSLSSQLLTGLLIALPLAKDNSEITVDNLKSKPYIDMTIELIKLFGGSVINNNYKKFIIKGNSRYKSPGTVACEGDWSGASFFASAAALCGSVEILNLQSNSKQADKAVIDVIKKTGAEVEFGKRSLVVKKAEVLKPFVFDASDAPDLFPPLAALASGCNGISEIKGVSRLKHKESDRGNTLIKEFAKAGIIIDSKGDVMRIRGGEFKPCETDSHNDHRIAMALACAALRGKGKTVIDNAEAVEKSYPDFFEDLKSIGGKVNE